MYACRELTQGRMSGAGELCWILLSCPRGQEEEGTPFGKVTDPSRSSSKKGCVNACSAEYLRTGEYCSNLETCTALPSEGPSGNPGRMVYCPLVVQC